MPSSSSASRPPSLDGVAAQRWQALSRGPSAWLHEEVARRMEQRLAWIKLQPQAWAHWQPLRGGMEAHALLCQRYPQAARYVVEPTPAAQAAAKRQLSQPWWHPKAWRSPVTQFAPPADGAVQMLWANMLLHMADNPQSLIQHWQRALSVDGFVMFSCLGPDTLAELRALYQRLGWPPPAHEFTDMHDWGDMLIAAGFAEPVMDMERITLSFATPARLLQELRGLGRNLHVQRFAGLRGRVWQTQLQAGLAHAPLTLSFEVIYGHAFKAKPRLNVRPETTLSVDQMRDALKAAKTYPKLA